MDCYSLSFFFTKNFKTQSRNIKAIKLRASQETSRREYQRDIKDSSKKGKAKVKERVRCTRRRTTKQMERRDIEEEDHGDHRQDDPPFKRIPKTAKTHDDSETERVPSPVKRMDMMKRLARARRSSHVTAAGYHWYPQQVTPATASRMSSAPHVPSITSVYAVGLKEPQASAASIGGRSPVGVPSRGVGIDSIEFGSQRSLRGRWIFSQPTRVTGETFKCSPLRKNQL